MINTCILFLNQKQLMKTWQWTLEIFYPQDSFLSYFRKQNLLSTMPIKGKDYIDLFCNLNLMWLHKIKWNRRVKKSKYESSSFPTSPLLKTKRCNPRKKYLPQYSHDYSFFRRQLHVTPVCV